MNIEKKQCQGANRILDKYQSELLSGSHEFITPNDLEQYMEILSVEGSSGNFKFYNSGLMDDLIQALDQNKKTYYNLLKN